MRRMATKPGSARKLAVGLVGPGQIGKVLIKQIEGQRQYLKVCTPHCELGGSGSSTAGAGGCRQGTFVTCAN
jgi:hypothetical protein